MVLLLYNGVEAIQGQQEPVLQILNVDLFLCQ